jgi:hypothetical protein
MFFDLHGNSLSREMVYFSLMGNVKSAGKSAQGILTAASHTQCRVHRRRFGNPPRASAAGRKLHVPQGCVASSTHVNLVHGVGQSKYLYLNESSLVMGPCSTTSSGMKDGQTLACAFHFAACGRDGAKKRIFTILFPVFFLELPVALEQASAGLMFAGTCRGILRPGGQRRYLPSRR